MQAIQKSPSLFRTLTQSVFDPHAADFWLQKVNPIWSTSRALAQIIKKTSCKRYDQFNFANQSPCEVGQAGQHHPVKVKIDGRLYERSYSLTERDGDLILTVKKLLMVKSVLGYTSKAKWVILSNLVSPLVICN
jgi:hypothetical protein